MKALIDGDVLLYQAVHRGLTAMSTDGEHYIYSFDLSELVADFDSNVRAICHSLSKKLSKDVGSVICLSDRQNFRKLKVNPEYKANRTERKPLAVAVLKDEVIKRYAPIIQPKLEADDVMGVLHTIDEQQNTVVCSIDKDMFTLPGLFYHVESGELHEVSPEAAERFHLSQTLMGDRVDNYFGCPGIGEATAAKLFDTVGCTWRTVVEAYESKGLTEKDALMNARCAKILTAKNYSFDTKRIKLWKPSDLEYCV